MGFLAGEGFEAVHWSSLGAFDAADRVLMAWAAEHGCIVLTHDLDFSAILTATGGAKPSVVQLRADDVRPEAIGAQLVAALRQAARELSEGVLLTLDTTRAAGFVCCPCRPDPSRMGSVPGQRSARGISFASAAGKRRPSPSDAPSRRAAVQGRGARAA